MPPVIFPPAFQDTELVLGLVGAVGTDLAWVTKVIEHHLSKFRYRTKTVRISSLIPRFRDLTTVLNDEPAFDRYMTYMDGGNEVREKFKRGDVLALAAVTQIQNQRAGEETVRPVTHLIRSLKHPDEVDALRTTYGAGFFLLGVYSPRQKRLKLLRRKERMKTKQAKLIMARDEAEPNALGQRTRDTFQRADAFIALNQPDAQKQLERILDLLFGSPHVSPTDDEHAMFLAYAASLRSADLSRQVGALIRAKNGDVIATGANDVPCYGGGLYWPDGRDQRDHVRGFDSNERRRDEMLIAVMKKFRTGVSDDELLEEGKALLKDTGLLDITEFGRAVHAEMEALLSCARTGASPQWGTLYSTTFPCHNCAKHIVGAGIRRVVYVEPYPKSQAAVLHGDAIQIDPGEVPDDKVGFMPFVGIGPRRYFDLFSLKLSSGYPVARKGAKGSAVPWDRATARVRIPILPASYLDREKLAAKQLVELTGGGNGDAEAN